MNPYMNNKTQEPTTIRELAQFISDRFATKEDLKQFATKKDLERFATKL